MIFNGFPFRGLSLRGRVGSVLAAGALLIPGFAAAEDFDLVVVYPGGPNPGSSGQRVIDDFVAKLTAELSMSLQGSYFNEIEEAAAYLAEHPNSFVFGSTGFFLAQREDLSLVPELAMVLPDEHPEQYFVVTRKGAFADLASMKGKKIAGSPFFEAQSFLDRIVFGGETSIADFEVEPTNRPLTALRKLTSGDVDGVLLAAPQYHSLEGLPLAEELDTVFTSKAIPSVGFMRIDNDVTAEVAPGISEALLRLAETPEGAEACKGFGVAGFLKPDPAKVTELIEVHDAP